jgi:Na+-driven multidrug efflux pump
MARLLRVSLTGISQMAIPHVAWIALVRIVSLFGSAAIAGYTIGIRIVIFVILPSWGLSGAAATLVGQNLGARQPERAEKSVWTTAYYNMIFLGGVGVILIFLAGPVIRLFTHDPEVVPMGVSCLRILSFGNVAYAYGMVMLQAFNGAGDTRTPTIINFFGFWLLEIPLAYALPSLSGCNPTGSTWRSCFPRPPSPSRALFYFDAAGGRGSKSERLFAPQPLARGCLCFFVAPSGKLRSAPGLEGNSSGLSEPSPQNN